MQRTLYLRQSDIWTRRGPVNIRWSSYLQALMRSLDIVFLDEGIELTLLLQQVHASWFGCCLLQIPDIGLVTASLLVAKSGDGQQ